ncbi:ABC transporter ATP-binding protein [Polycladomyces sp. WAk]|uniref:ABC transporter ATP-binding protein n=1 Tax=Polycladomyces zharkentensis TaxID=2807616 RepID=A0ABS2WG27_9BACL|nr:ABC transporter ATP-binding protein [Polycladomyces sp. WAk]MBN2908468.1 ABC transporter ATP-binding protein [Polycladomyces sp. WAk]
MIELQGVTKRFGSFAAVRQVSLHVSRGEIFGLLGANGAGKTTLIRMMCGILKPTEGTGTILGWDMIRDQQTIKENIGYMSQKFSLYPDLTVEENLRFYAHVYGVRQPVAERVESLLREFELTGVRKTRVSELSGGVRQRVAFASAIVHEPPLLFLDEPTSGVDPLTRRAFWEMLYQMADRGTTIVVTTHYMDEAERCDRMAWMNRGRIVAEGSLAELRRRFAPRVGNRKATLEEMFVYAMEEGEDHDGQDVG